VDGTPFGRYRLVELLGHGGMGEVWRAYDPTMDRMVALKVLPPNFAGDKVFQERFRREARAAAGLDEPHVVPFHDFGEVDGQLYVTMRLIKGRDLQTILAEGPLSPERAVRIIEQVAKALHAAHRIGLIHRDIKPSNILVAEDDDFAYLIDFGIARAAGETGLTGTGAAIGTWHYMSPERLQAGQVDARSDIYALACVLYECLTGSPPYPGDNLEQQITAHLTSPPPRPSMLQPGVPQSLDAVIAKGMAKQPHQRYASTVELARAARAATTVPLPHPGATVPVYPRPAGPIHSRYTELAAAGAAPALQPPPGPPLPWAQPTPKRPMWRRPRNVIPALLVVVVLIGGGVFAAVKVAHRHNPTATAPPAAAPPNTGPFTGTYRADFGPSTNLDGKPHEGGTPTTETWGVRSVCRSGGCVATASRIRGHTSVSKLVFDDVGGRWLAVGVGSDQCKNAPAEHFEVFTLQPHPDGTLSGEYSSTFSNACADKFTVTFTRTGDVDVNSLPDPASQPPWVVSPAEALHGRYHLTRTGDVTTQEYDVAVRTDCLRTGDRCMSYFHDPEGGAPLVFAGGKWTLNVDAPCSAGGTHVERNANYPLPQPPQDPITLLTGHGHDQATGSACVGGDFDEKFVRTGD
jgi:protein kinase-like protein